MKSSTNGRVELVESFSGGDNFFYSMFKYFQH